MRNVHIIPNEKFTKDFIKRINTEFGVENNYFLVLKNHYSELLEETFRENVKTIEITKKNCLKVFIEVLKYNKIFLHNLGVIHPFLLLLLSFLPKKIKKQYWIMWGMDLYCYKEKKESMKEKVKEWIRGKFIRNLFGIIFWVKGDYELACKWYGTKAKFFSGGYWDENAEFLESVFSKKVERNDGLIKIQVGNSAAFKNYHIDALRKLKQIDLENMIIYCPLSYPINEEYIHSVIEEGKALFGERFIPIREFMPKDEYIEYLNTIDIGIFNSDRQMGLGNMTLLASLGKKVYINDYTTSWKYYEERGIKIFAFNRLDFTNEKIINEFFEPLSEKQKQDNFSKVLDNKKTAIQSWKDIFES